MVVMHEFAHLKKKALPLATNPCVAACALDWAQCHSSRRRPVTHPQSVLCSFRGRCSAWLMASAIMLFEISYWSRLCEFDADRVACQLAFGLHLGWREHRFGSSPLGQCIDCASWQFRANHQQRGCTPALGQRLSRLGIQCQNAEAEADLVQLDAPVSGEFAVNVATERTDLACQ